MNNRPGFNKKFKLLTPKDELPFGTMLSQRHFKLLTIASKNMSIIEIGQESGRVGHEAMMKDVNELLHRQWARVGLDVWDRPILQLTDWGRHLYEMERDTRSRLAGSK